MQPCLDCIHRFIVAGREFITRIAFVISEQHTAAVRLLDGAETATQRADGVAEAFIEWAKKEKLSFWK